MPDKNISIRTKETILGNINGPVLPKFFENTQAELLVGADVETGKIVFCHSRYPFVVKFIGVYRYVNQRYVVLLQEGIQALLIFKLTNAGFAPYSPYIQENRLTVKVLQ